MPLKLNVGLSKKIGQPAYGSLGASCHVEIELDQSLLFGDVDGLQERIQNVFAACREAVTEELARSPNHAPSQQDGKSGTRCTTQDQGLSDNLPGAGGHRASHKQLDYAQQLASQIRGLGTRRLGSLAFTMFSKPLEDLSSLDASSLIDMLKDLKAGKVELPSTFNGVAA